MSRSSGCTSPSTSRRSRRSRTRCGSGRTRSPGRRPGRLRGSPPAPRSTRSRATGSRSCDPLATMRCPATRWGSACSATSPSPRATHRMHSGSSASRSSTGTSTTATAPRRSSAATTRCCSSRCTSGRSIRAPAGSTTTTTRRSTSRSRPAPTTPHMSTHSSTRLPRRSRRSAPDALIVSAGFDAHLEDPLAEMAMTEAGFEELARRCSTLAPRVSAVLEGGYNLETLPGLVEAALRGFTEEIRRGGRCAARPPRLRSPPRASSAARHRVMPPRIGARGARLDRPGSVLVLPPRRGCS